jgi:hypothetical protein
MYKERLYMAVWPRAQRLPRAWRARRRGVQRHPATQARGGRYFIYRPSGRYSRYRPGQRPSQPSDTEGTVAILSEDLMYEWFLGQLEAQLPDSAFRLRRPVAMAGLLRSGTPGERPPRDL